MTTDRPPLARRRRIAALAGSAAALLLAAPALAADPAVSGEWVLDLKGAPKLRAEDIPLTPEAHKLADAASARQKAGNLISEGHRLCLPDGMPHLMAAPFAINILQTRGRITMLAEVSNLPRVVYLDQARQPAEFDPTWNGHSIGRWEGKVLLVDTIGFNDRFAQLFNAGVQVRRSSRLHVTERIFVGRDGYLVDQMTMEDPGVFTRPFTVTYTYRRLPENAETMELVCEVDPETLSAPAHP